MQLQSCSSLHIIQQCGGYVGRTSIRSIMDVMQQIIYSETGIISVWEGAEPLTLEYYSSPGKAFAIKH